jgi:hypothetical protein
MGAKLWVTYPSTHIDNDYLPSFDAKFRRNDEYMEWCHAQTYPKFELLTMLHQFFSSTHRTLGHRLGHLTVQLRNSFQ